MATANRVKRFTSAGTRKRKRSSASSTGSRKKKLSKRDAFRRLILTNPKRWARETYGVDIWSGQEQIIKSVLTHKRTAVRGCIASSKTYAAALCIHAFMQSFWPVKVFATAPTFRQVQYALWAETRSLYHKARIDIGGDMKPVAPEWHVDDDSFAMGFSTDKPDQFHGFHGGGKILVIIDEGQGIPRSTFEALENIMAGGNAHLLLLSNPTSSSGEAYDAFHSKANLYNLIKIAAQDTPNFKARKVVVSGMITYEQAMEWIDTYGIESDFVQVKVFANFPKQTADTVVPLHWIEESHTRRIKVADDDPVDLGVDVGRFGDDESVIQPLKGRLMYPVIAMKGNDTMQVVGKVIKCGDEMKARSYLIDDIGVGGGVTDRCLEQKKPAIGVNVSRSSNDKKKFANLRSELWWGVRENLDPKSDQALSMNKDLVRQAELSSIRFKINSKGQIQVEPKEDMKSRLGHSPDRGDAACLAVYGRFKGGQIDIPSGTVQPTGGIQRRGGLGGMQRLTSRIR